MTGKRLASASNVAAPRAEIEMLGSCPRCSHAVLANPEAVRYDGSWYHLRCALERQSSSGAGRSRAATS